MLEVLKNVFLASITLIIVILTVLVIIALIMSFSNEVKELTEKKKEKKIMYAIIKRKGEEPVEKNIDFTPEFFKEYFGDVKTGAYCLPWFNINIYFPIETDEPINVKIFDISFYGDILITGGKENGEPCSIEPFDARFIRKYLDSCKCNVKKKAL